MKRGLFLEAFHRTVQGLSGAVFRKDPVVTHREDDAIRRYLEDVTGDKQPLERFTQRILNDDLTIGHVGIMVTMAADALPGDTAKLRMVPGENIINWDDNGRWIVLEEKVMDVDPTDIFMRKEVTQWRYLYLDDLGQYQVEVWRKNEQAVQNSEAEKFMQVGDTITPLRLGQPLDFLPFWIVSGNQRTMDPDKPPLLGLADASFDHYRMMTDYRHGLHFTALPTPWFAGFNQKEAILIGAETAIVAENPAASAGMLEFEGQGLNPLKEALEAVMQYMAALGARLLEQSKKAVESADTHKLRAAAEQTTVQSMAKTVGEAMGEAVRTALWWSNLQDDSFTITLNTDLVDAQTDVELLKALSTDLIAGHISYETYYHHLEAAELTRPNVTAQDERALLEQVEDDTFDQAAA
jgi:hypothetical protein